MPPPTTAATSLFPRIVISIDRGGTFTDVVASVQDVLNGPLRTETCKLLSVNPDHYPDAPSEGIRRILERCTGVPVGRPIPTDHLQEIRMGTTVATNALLEHRGIPSVQVVSRGFRDILEIGNQARPEIFALHIKKPKPLPAVVVEAQERVRIVGSGPLASSTETPRQRAGLLTESGHVVEVVEDLNEAAITTQLQDAFQQGIRSVGVSLMHSYAFAAHEQRIGAIARAIGFEHVSLSSELMPMIKYVPRTTTSSVDAYLTPLIAQYVSNFRSHFVDALSGTRLLFIQSDGGLTSADAFFGFKAVLSGPAGGVVGCARTTCKAFGSDVQVVGFDMGGTSTDVSRCEGLHIDHTMEANIAGTLVQSPQVEVHTVAAGGGSVLKWENSMFVVGPESAGAYPGPACYGRDGPLTVTDANVLLGRVQRDFFPSIFGPHANAPLDCDVVAEKFAALTDVINRSAGSTLTPTDVAAAFVAVANEAMCRPIRNLTEAKGRAADQHVLCVFGGAGGQHACGVADALGIRKIFIHRLSSFLSAVGIGLTDIVEERVQSSTLSVEATPAFGAAIGHVLRQLQDDALNALETRHGVTTASPSSTSGAIVVERLLNLRFEGTNTAVTTALPDVVGGANADDVDGHAVLAAYSENYRRQFGFVLTNRRVLVDEVLVRARATTNNDTTASAACDVAFDEAAFAPVRQDAAASVVKAYFSSGNAMPTPAFVMGPLLHSSRIAGPALIIGDGATIVVEPTAVAFVTKDGHVIIHTNRVLERIGTTRQPLPLSIFSHRFMSIAEQMGYTLQRTSISTNIKERLDFSCAIFDPDGNLVANAPHIPVHLGAMGAAVRWQRDFYGNDWREGDVMLSNHPSAGGSHLPDITVMTACFHEGKVIFYVASRGHHADVGGSTPGSMPPFSRSIDEEGAAIKTLRLVENGTFNETGLRDALMEPGNREGMSGCRTLEDSVSDLKAQVAANHRGLQLVQALVKDYGLAVVQAYMKHIQDAAEEAARGVLRNVATKYGTSLGAEDLMDDGSAIRLKVSIDPSEGSAVFDFRASDPQVLSSTNCPTAVVLSAVIYCIRCMVGSDMPLNQGCLAPVSVLVTPGSILCPDDDCAVVAGNVLTSQRVTDVIFMALRAVACAQGCMNNFTFGNATVAYYETICGGSGGGPTFDGASCVQTHMTNTRITDPEILETRYPVMLMQFEVRRGSGGIGAHVGGDGCVRALLFLEPMITSIVSERRALHPRGLDGGGDGARGLNLLHRLHDCNQAQPPAAAPNNGRAIWGGAAALLWRGASASATQYRTKNVGGKNTIHLQPGDVFHIQTPGGGGYGPASLKHDQ